MSEIENQPYLDISARPLLVAFEALIRQALIGLAKAHPSCLTRQGGIPDASNLGGHRHDSLHCFTVCGPLTHCCSASICECPHIAALAARNGEWTARGDKPSNFATADPDQREFFRNASSATARCPLRGETLQARSLGDLQRSKEEGGQPARLGVALFEGVPVGAALVEDVDFLGGLQ